MGDDDKNKLDSVCLRINELEEDSGIPKNVKDKLEEIKKILGSSEELSVKVHKALHELDEISADINLQPYTRTLIWNISSEMEKVISS